MNFKRRLILSGILVVLLFLALQVFPAAEGIVKAYDRIIYFPFQSIRDVLFGYLPFSAGDAFYILGGFMLLLTIIKWVKYLIKFKQQKMKLASSMLNTLNIALGLYLFFIFGWGANYYKEPLAKTWGLRHEHDTVKLAEFDSILVSELNTFVVGYHDLNLGDVNKIAVNNYRLYTDTRLTRFGLNIKHSFFGYFLERVAVEGYYNPFTGEGQVSSRLPAFMLPFVVSHEMAHQAGIAAEGDANLMAYAVSKTSDNPAFKYSADLNVWLYIDRRLRRKDSVLADKYKNQLNALTLNHTDILDSLSDLYDNDVSAYTAEMYDNYLKMQQQKDGIKSYSSIVLNAWLWEKQNAVNRQLKLNIP